MTLEDKRKLYEHDLDRIRCVPGSSLEATWMEVRAHSNSREEGMIQVAKAIVEESGVRGCNKKPRRSSTGGVT